MDRSATYDFLLVIHSNRGPISYRFQDKRQFWLKIAIFPTPRIINTPVEGLSLEFCKDDDRLKNDRVMPY